MGHVTADGLSFYDTLCIIRTSVLNAVVEAALKNNTGANIVKLLDSISEEIICNNFDFERELFELEEEELLDLGFDYLDDESDFMLFPIWLLAFMPEGATFLDVDDEPFCKGTDTVKVYNNQWINVGFYLDEIQP